MRRRSSICQLAIANNAGSSTSPSLRRHAIWLPSSSAATRSGTSAGAPKNSSRRRGHSSWMSLHPSSPSHSQSPSRPSSSKLRQQAGTSWLDVEIEEQALDVGRRNRVEEEALASRNDRGQHDERVEARAREDDHAARVRLLEGLEGRALGP